MTYKRNLSIRDESRFERSSRREARLSLRCSCSETTVDTSCRLGTYPISCRTGCNFHMGIFPASLLLLLLFVVVVVVVVIVGLANLRLTFLLDLLLGDGMGGRGEKLGRENRKRDRGWRLGWEFEYRRRRRIVTSDSVRLFAARSGLLPHVS